MENEQTNDNNVEPITKGQKLQKLIDVVELNMTKVYDGNFEHVDAEKIAAASWGAQFSLGTILADARLHAKQAKNLVKLVKSEVDKDFRTPTPAEKKKTEVQIESLVISDSRVVTAENNLLKAEHEAEKWEFVLKSLSDAHIFFKNLNRLQ